VARNLGLRRTPVDTSLAGPTCGRGAALLRRSTGGLGCDGRCQSDARRLRTRGDRAGDDRALCCQGQAIRLPPLPPLPGGETLQTSATATLTAGEVARLPGLVTV
jgi:hypothetical protein